MRSGRFYTFLSVTKFSKPRGSHVTGRGLLAPRMGIVAPLKEEYFNSFASFLCINQVTYCIVVDMSMIKHKIFTYKLKYILFNYVRYCEGTAVAQCCDTNQKVAGTIPAGVVGIFSCRKILPTALWPWGRLSFLQK